MTGGSWISVTVFPGADRDAIVAALFAAGSLGVEELGDAVRTHFSADIDRDALICTLLAASAGARVEVAPAVVVDWTEQWKHGIHAQELGEITVAPPWLADARDPARTVVIDPGMAFGTGEHATTRGVVRLLPRTLHAGDRVADLGAGSAVLSIAAAKLGASHVFAIELDADAIGNATANVERNGVADRVTILAGDAAQLLPLVAPVQAVLANIISTVLTALLPTIAQSLAPRGRAILSGILVEERAAMLDVLGAAGWRVDGEDAEDVWWTVAISRP